MSEKKDTVYLFGNVMDYLSNFTSKFTAENKKSNDTVLYVVFALLLIIPTIYFILIMAPKKYSGIDPMSLSDIVNTMMTVKKGRGSGILFTVLLLCMVAGLIGIITTAALSKKKFGVDHTNDEKM